MVNCRRKRQEFSRGAKDSNIVLYNTQRSIVCFIILLCMTKFLLVRHATNPTVGKTLTGRAAGVHLNEAGKKQAQHLAVRLAGAPITAIYSSPMERAVETAAPIAAALQLQTQIDAQFTEIDFGEWTGASFETLQSNAGFQRFNSFRSNTRVPGGETMLEAQTRFIQGMEKLAARHAGEKVVIVSHADVIKAAVAFFAGIHLDLFQRLEISPASVSVIDLYSDAVRLLQVNCTGDLMI